MQSYQPSESKTADVSDNAGSSNMVHAASVVSAADYSITEDAAQIVNEPTHFYSHFIDHMEMYADQRTVAAYLDRHHEWFYRCAAPMTVEPIGENSYALVIGHFGSFGYQVEPKIGLDLLPQDEGVYRIETVPVPGYVSAGYEVDFRAAMELVEIPLDETHDRPAGTNPTLDKITRVQWALDLNVLIQFPRFIHALPESLIKSTGDRVLQQVVRQVSGRLTRKVLEDFHKTHDLPVPKRSRHWFSKHS